MDNPTKTTPITRSRRKTRTGIVVSNRMEKSIVVEIRRRIKHPTYKKYIGRNTKLMAHDADNACQIGDKVQIMETRPLSRHKAWRLTKIIEKTTSKIEPQKHIPQSVEATPKEIDKM